MYYICNDPNPRDGTLNGAELYEKLIDASADAVEMATQDRSGQSWYVHETQLTKVIYRASSVVTVDTEVLNAPEA